MNDRSARIVLRIGQIRSPSSNAMRNHPFSGSTLFQIQISETSFFPSST